jgi:hypothetical protein
MSEADGDPDIEVTFTSESHRERVLPEPRELDAWEASILDRLCVESGVPVPDVLVHVECSHCPSVVLADIGPTMTTDGYLHQVLPMELVGDDLDGMTLHFMLRVLSNGSPSWLEAYRDDGQPFQSRPSASSLKAGHLWADFPR